MSYDLGLYIDAGNGSVRIENFDWNYTYNLGNFFEWALEKRLKEFNGEDAWYFLDCINHALYKISQGEDLSRFEPSNGWGSVLGATCFLAKIGIACAKAPNAKVHVS